MLDSKLEEKIGSQLSKLQDLEDMDPLYIDDSIKELRNKVFHIHQRMEFSMEILIGQFLLSSIKSSKLDKAVKVVFNIKLGYVLNSMNFFKKITILRETQKVNDKIINKLSKLNDFRKWFAHPLTYGKEIELFNDRKKYCEALQLLIDIYENFDQTFILERKMKELEEDSK